MSEFSEALEDLNFAQQESFGETYIYQSPGGLTFAFSGIRLQRAPEQWEAKGSYEGLLIRESEFASGPDRGAFVTAGSTQYVVADLHDPHPYDGTKTLILVRRKASINA